MSGVDCVLIQRINKPAAVNAIHQSAGNIVILMGISYSESTEFLFSFFHLLVLHYCHHKNPLSNPDLSLVAKSIHNPETQDLISP
jgi:hypothetical protein